MTASLRTLGAVIAGTGVLMAAIAVYCLAVPLPRADLGSIAAFEIIAMAVLILPWFSVFSLNAALRFSSSEAASGAWGALSVVSVLLVLGQIAAYLPTALRIQDTDAVVITSGQLLPAAFRIALIWSLGRMLRAYRSSGLDFHMPTRDMALSAIVIVMTIVLITKRDTIFFYWSQNASTSETARIVMTAAQLVNFVLYPAVFVVSLWMFRYASQMGGGLVARAWGGVALYGLLQPLHVFVIATGWQRYGPMLSIVFDNFIVLLAFGALALGPLFQVRASRLVAEGTG